MTEPQRIIDPKQSLVLKVVGASGQATLFMKLHDLFPECEHLISDLVQMFPLRCLIDAACPRNQKCMSKLARRIKYVFDTFDDTELILLYFRYRDRPGSHRAGVFWRDMQEPRLVTFNRTAWEKMKEIGTVYEWRLPDSLFLETV